MHYYISTVITPQHLEKMLIQASGDKDAAEPLALVDGCLVSIFTNCKSFVSF
jgi:hypothetical protein